ncbi:sensor domain-containing protein [Streptomyces sp. SBT349]|uniref:sensor domain-containing protein n=1 Tax=Streptomyces sp. SBT349 TaxID=1580539 RepID=UPI00066B2412|nr:sensor domain-containing protein [Streptomyces sp. SBT349]
MTSTATRPLASDLAGRRAGRFGRELGYVLGGLPTGIVAFTAAVAGFSAGISTLVIWIGLPILAGTLRAARGMARVERRRVEEVTGRPLPPHVYRDRGGRGWAGIVGALSEPQSWRDLTHMVVSFPLRVVSFCVALTWTLGGAGALLYGTWSWSLPDDDRNGLFDLMTGVSSEAADIAFNTAVGAVLLLTALPVIRGLAALNAAVARGLLTNQHAASLAART